MFYIRRLIKAAALRKILLCEKNIFIIQKKFKYSNK